MTGTNLGVAEAKRRFSELLDRVEKGEKFIVSRRGTPIVALVPPGVAGASPRPRPMGLAAFAGALADWDDIESFVRDTYSARKRARDRRAPELE